MPIVMVAAMAFFLWVIYWSLWGRNRRQRSGKQSRRQNAAALRAHHEIRWSSTQDEFLRAVEAWPVAASAPYALCREGSVDVFAFANSGNEVRMLSNAWDVRNATDLRLQLLSLLRHGHRERFNSEREIWSALRGREATDTRNRMYSAAKHYSDAAEDFLRFRRVRKNTNDLMSIDFLAWDLVRVIMLARAGAAAGYLSAEEALDITFVASRGLQERFSSWEELGSHFLRGRWYWASESGSAEAESNQHDQHRQRVLTTSANSPWKVVPWSTSIPSPRYLVLDEVDPHELEDESAAEGAWKHQLEREIARRKSL